jgi:hypothetical protein
VYETGFEDAPAKLIGRDRSDHETAPALRHKLLQPHSFGIRPVLAGCRCALLLGQAVKPAGDPR